MVQSRDHGEARSAPSRLALGPGAWGAAWSVGAAPSGSGVCPPRASLSLGARPCSGEWGALPAGLRRWGRGLGLRWPGRRWRCAPGAVASGRDPPRPRFGGLGWGALGRRVCCLARLFARAAESGRGRGKSTLCFSRSPWQSALSSLEPVPPRGREGESWARLSVGAGRLRIRGEGRIKKPPAHPGETRAGCRVEGAPAAAPGVRAGSVALPGAGALRFGSAAQLAARLFPVVGLGHALFLIWGRLGLTQHRKKVIARARSVSIT